MAQAISSSPGDALSRRPRDLEAHPYAKDSRRRRAVLLAAVYARDVARMGEHAADMALVEDPVDVAPLDRLPRRLAKHFAHRLLGARRRVDRHALSFADHEDLWRDASD